MLLKVLLLLFFAFAFDAERPPILPDNGCAVLNKLWTVAQECSIERPGYPGVVDRVLGLIQCHNVRDFMSMATMKCWSERETKSLPPMFLKDVSVVSNGNYPSKKKQNTE